MELALAVVCLVLGAAATAAVLYARSAHDAATRAEAHAREVERTLTVYTAIVDDHARQLYRNDLDLDKAASRGGFDRTTED